MKPIIYHYLDYRIFLDDMFCFRKNKDDFFSYRYFSQKAGFASPNFLKLVINNHRNLTAKSIAKMAIGFKLTNPERDYFENMVFMCQAKTHTDRNHYYRKMMNLKVRNGVHRLAKASYDYFSKWYLPVIREVVLFEDRKLTASMIAKCLNPRISTKEAEKALATLVELKLIHKGSDGRWQQTNEIVTTGAEVKSMIIGNFHREMLRLAEESIERFPSEERDITSVTISINHAKMKHIKERCAAFRKELLEMTCGLNADQVIQINIQAFPLTTIKNKEQRS